MKKIIYGITTLLIVIMFNGCATQLVTYNKDTKIVSFKIDEKKRKELKLNHPIHNSRGGQCIQNHFVLVEKNIPKYGHIFIEHIEIAMKCQWNGLAEGYFVNYMKKYFKVKEVKKLNSIKVENYEFSTYLLDNYKKIQMIELWGTSQNTFIFDEKGIFSNELKNTLLKTKFIEKNYIGTFSETKENSPCILDGTIKATILGDNINGTLKFVRKGKTIIPTFTGKVIDNKIYGKTKKLIFEGNIKDNKIEGIYFNKVCGGKFNLNLKEKTGI